MAHAIIFLADTHGASRFGIWKRNAHLDDGLDDVRKYLLDCFDHARTVWLASVVGNLPRIVELCGDLVDGISPKVMLCTDDETEQMTGTFDILRPWCEGAEQVRGVAGTEFHGGKGAKWDNLACEMLGATPDETGRYARWQDWLTVDGVTLDVAHHISGSYVTSSQATPLTREYTDAGMSVYESGWPHADWIIRAHSHRYRIIPYKGATVVTLPGFQARTPYAHRISRGAPFDIGLFVLICDEGRAEPHVKLYKWPAPKVEVIEWTGKSQSQDSPSRIGSVFGKIRGLRKTAH